MYSQQCLGTYKCLFLVDTMPCIQLLIGDLSAKTFITSGFEDL